MKQQRPEKVDVLGKTFTYKFVSNWKGRKKDEVGECDPVTQDIFIKIGQTFEAEQDTVIHEYVEAAAAQLSFSDDHDLIVRITTMIHQMFKNHELVAYLSRKK